MSFAFKQFTIRQDRCAMKVGTDGVLLGAWALLPPTGRILDVGTGTGLIALMAAQRTSAEVVGVEIDPDAAQQARENVEASPWAGRCTIVCSDIKSFESAERFDTILSNPPLTTPSSYDRIPMAARSFRLAHSVSRHATRPPCLLTFLHERQNDC